MSDSGYKETQDSLKIAKTSGFSVNTCGQSVQSEHMNTYTQSQSAHWLFVQVK